MFACLHGDAAKLLELARMFSPSVEIAPAGSVVFSIQGLGRLFGTTYQIAAEIARRGAGLNIMANLAIAADPDSAALAASNFAGVTIIPPGEEAERLGKIPLHRVSMPEELLETLQRWGLKTLGDVAALPPAGLAERLGEAGVRLYELALGRRRRPLQLAPPPACYSEQAELEDPVSQLEPLMFVLGRMLHEICRRLVSQSMAANRITTKLRLEGRREHSRVLELPVPQNQAMPLLKLLQLDLEAHPPEAPITAVTLALDPVKPRTLQHGLFLPLAPEPEKLEVTLARIRAMAGEGNVGSPELLDTYRPDGFCMRPFTSAGVRARRQHAPVSVQLVFRFYRPARPARVRVSFERPLYVAAQGVQGEVAEAAGPWRSSGDWWTKMQWARDEWDVAIDRSGLYRIYCDLDAHEWFVEGVYD